jgi:hypothetical protein
MLDRASEMHIEILNKYLGMNHRTVSYDLTKTSELKSALEYAVAAYKDYSHYSVTLGSLVENFDESVEHFDTASWVRMSRAPDDADDLIMKCVSSLSETFYDFIDLTKRAEKHLSNMMMITLTAPSNVQKEILGASFEIAPADIEGWLKFFLSELYQADYHCSIPDNFKTFLEVVKIVNAEWSEFNPESSQASESGSLPF